MNNNKNKIDYLCFWIIIFGGIFYKLYSTKLPLFGDLGLWGFSQKVYDKFLLNFYIIPHPPLGPVFYRILAKIFGVSGEALRLCPVLLTFVAVFVIFMFARKFYDEKIAMTAVFLMFFTYFPYQASLTPDLDTTYLPLIMIIIVYCLYRYAENKNVRFICFIGMLHGISLMVKLQTFIFLPPLFLSVYYIEKNILRSLQKLIVVFLISLAVFSIFPAFIYVFENQFFSVIMDIIIKQNSTQIFMVDNKIALLSFLPLAIVLTPLYIFLPLISFLQRDKKDDILYIWLITLLAIYIITIPSCSAGDFPRYYAILIPILAIISAKVLKQLSFSARKIIVLGIAAIVLALFIAYINEKNIFPNWYVVSATGLTQRISKKILYYFLGIGNLLGILWLVARGKRIEKTAASLFLIVVFALNVFMMLNVFLNKEYFYTMEKLLSYAKTHGFKTPVYAWDEEVPFYLGCRGADPLQSKQEKIVKYAEYLGVMAANSYIDISGDDYEFYKNDFKIRGGTVFLFNYPSEYGMNTKEKQEVFRLIKENCRTKLEIMWDGRNAGGIYECIR